MVAVITKESPVSYLRQEYEQQRDVFDRQSVIVQRFIETQARHLAEALTENVQQVRFVLPDRVVAEAPTSGDMVTMLVPEELREHFIGRKWLTFSPQTLREAVRLTLSQLEQSPDQAINSSTALLRFATAHHMIYQMLPDGRAVTYRADGDEQIPSIPVKAEGEIGSALTLAGDAVAEEHPTESARGDLQIPFVPSARRFYLPQWVSFDDQGKLLVNSASEAEAHQASMERYLSILHAASSLAPYMVADETYQRKRYGMLGQVINQGRALARYQTAEIIKTIMARLNSGTLNRGLSVTLPYYDDQDLYMREVNLEAIPAGRIPFKAVFVVRAVNLEQAKVSQDTRLNASTRRHLLYELDMLKQAFENLRKK